ncbi:nesp117 [Neophasia sp. alphabaculovirus]|nr:nesp117 [Neophasia sp. alphabaculovirus]
MLIYNIFTLTVQTIFEQGRTCPAATFVTVLAISASFSARHSANY